MNESFTEILRAAERAVAGSEADKSALGQLLEGVDLASLGQPEDRSYLAVLLDWIGMRQQAMLALSPGDAERDAHRAGLSNLAAMLAWEHGEHQRARELFEQALPASREAGQLRVKVLANLATLAMLTGNLESASLWSERARADQAQHDDSAERDDFATDVLLASVGFGLARAADNLAEMRSAVLRLNKATRARIAELGSDHPLALTAVASLAAAEFDMASAEGTVESQERAITVLEVAAHRLAADLGADHPQALTCLENLCVADFSLARTIRSPDRAARAATMLESVSIRMDAALGESHPQARAAAANAASAALTVQEALPVRGPAAPVESLHPLPNVESAEIALGPAATDKATTSASGSAGVVLVQELSTARPETSSTSGHALRMAFVLDVEGYGKRSAPERADVQQRLRQLVDAMLAGCGLKLDPQVVYQWTGDGINAILPATIDPAVVLVAMITSLAAGLREDNASHSDRIRVRMAIGVGIIERSPAGFGGPPIIEINRLADSAAMRSALANEPDAHLAVAVSDQAHALVIEPGYSGIPDDQFTRVNVAAKEFSGNAWIWLSTRQLTEHANPPPRATVDADPEVDATAPGGTTRPDRAQSDRERPAQISHRRSASGRRGDDARGRGPRTRRIFQLNLMARLLNLLVRLQFTSMFDVTIFTGLDAMTMPLLNRLAETARSPRAIVVIEPARANPLLDEVRSLGVRVVIGWPASTTLLRSIISSWRGCALSRLYALRSKIAENEAVIGEVAHILSRYQPDPDRSPHLVTLVKDPRHADHWRGTRCGIAAGWFEDALSPTETTARNVVSRVLRTQPRHLLVCGDSTLTLAILLELARRAWEQTELVNAAAAGRSVAPGVLPPPDSPSPLPLQRVALFDLRSHDIRREYRASAPAAVLESLPSLVAHPVQWRDHLLRTLDAMDPAQARETAVIIAEGPPGSGVHEAGRVARLHPETPVFVLAGSGDSTGGAIFDLLQPFEPGLLVEGDVPEDAWTRVARHWHECFRLSHPVPAGHPQASDRVPWSELDPFLKQDYILRLRSVLSAVAVRGRQWVPVRLVPPGSVIELSEEDLSAVMVAEHTRWLRRRLAAGQAGEDIVPWEELPRRTRADMTAHLRSQLAQLEDLGFVPTAPPGGPWGAARFERVGLVRANQLTEPLAWVNHAGEQMHGYAGDWRVIDDAGNLQTVTDSEFQSSHEPVGDGRWRRVGTYQAWQVSEAMVVRTKEGKATARPGDWVVEAPTGERWPVPDQQFRWSYRPISAVDAHSTNHGEAIYLGGHLWQRQSS